jgi:hypothetical protein
LLPFYSTARTAKFVREYLKSVGGMLKWLDGHMYDAKFNTLALPLYPQKGGLFPFMADIDGPIYCWLTEPKSPNRWPVYCWIEQRITVLPDITISGMLLGFLERSPRMIRIWGDVGDYEPERIRIDDVCVEG